MRLNNKVAIITGATSGIGRAAAELFAKEGAKVILFARRNELGKTILNNIKKIGGDGIFIKGDVSVSKDVKKVINETIKRYGKIDILFNNAGINEKTNPKPHEETEERWDRILNTNLKGTYLFIKYVIPEMIKNKNGSIINNSSVLGSQAVEATSAAYHASKGGVTAYTKKAAISYAKYNIRVNAIQPGFIATEMGNIKWEQLTDTNIIEEKKKKQPLPKMGHPLDVAYAALYFGSDESAYVTGATLLVDGGISSLLHE